MTTEQLIAALKLLAPSERAEVIEAVTAHTSGESFTIEIDMLKDSKTGKEKGLRYRRVYTWKEDGKTHIRRVHIPKKHIETVVAHARANGLLREGKRRTRSLPATVSPTISADGFEESGAGG